MNIDIEECYKKYAPMVFRRCFGILRNDDEARDAVQDVFVSLLRHQKRLHNQFLSSLLYTVATNICLNRLRKRKRQVSDGEDPQELFPAVSDSQFDRIEKNMIIEAILRDESESTRAICFMYHSDGMTLREIGEAIGLSISGVRKRLIAFNTRAKIKLVEGEW